MHFLNTYIFLNIRRNITTISFFYSHICAYFGT